MNNNILAQVCCFMLDCHKNKKYFCVNRKGASESSFMFGEFIFLNVSGGHHFGLADCLLWSASATFTVLEQIALKSVFKTQIYMRHPRTCAIFIPAWDSNWWSSDFTVIKIIVVRHVRMLPAVTYGPSVKMNARKTPHGARRSWTHLLCICSFVCGWQ